ncbi:MAG: hypothetical protein AB7P03_05230 [Kofleriaceae bacterium]
MKFPTVPFVLAPLVAGCSSDMLSAGEIEEVPEPGPATIRVRNDGTRTLYVQASGWSGQAYLAVLRGDGRRIGSDTCEVCNCQGCPDCAVCGRTLASVRKLEPGEQIERTWDQLDWRRIENGCRDDLACEQPTLIAPGRLVAQATYSDSFEETDIYGPLETFIGPAITATAEFVHPAQEVVLVPIQ